MPPSNRQWLWISLSSLGLALFTLGLLLGYRMTPTLPTNNITTLTLVTTTTTTTTTVPYINTQLDRLAQCESPTGRDSNNRMYHGYFQFLLSTWRSMGESGDPSEYSYQYQREVAKRLQEKSGWSQWPTCARRLGFIND